MFCKKNNSTAQADKKGDYYSQSPFIVSILQATSFQAFQFSAPRGDAYSTD